MNSSKEEPPYGIFPQKNGELWVLTRVLKNSEVKDYLASNGYTKRSESKEAGLTIFYKKKKK